ncbi:MAG: DUF1501 domain-containing protein, partial [Planctomycetota bacterium]|nr:DUF1501 domain-containing protein [Planctomycetota bacterium]
MDSPVNENLARREFVKQLTAATAAAWAAGAPRLLPADDASAIDHPRPTADSCIVLWMAGGMAAPETFDPKPYHPFEIGLPVEKVMSTFRSIDTAVDNIKISEGLEEIGQVLDRGTLIRSHVLPDLGSILHSPHQYHSHTGYVPPQTVAAPHIGAWMSRVLGPRNPVIPAFINIGQRLEGVGENEEIKAFTQAGFFGSDHGPMNLPFPEEAARAVKPPRGMDPGRFARREKLLKEVARRGEFSDFRQESLARSLENAHRLLSSKDREAFDISLEPKESFDKYNTGRFGQGCLLARRLVEAGARYVEVTTEYIPFVHWDTHANGHETVDRLHKEIDRPIATLIRDLEARGLLDRTLVVLASEFSRDMIIEGVPGSTARDQATAPTDVLKELKHYGMHRHFTGASCVLMFGGGIKKGQLYGETAPERPCIAIKNPISVRD